MTTTNVLPTPSPVWPGPNYDPTTGSVALGPFIERPGLARWRVYSDRRMWGGFLAGETVTLETLGLSLAATDVTTVWFADPQGGAGSALLARHADYTARSVPGIRLMLSEALLVKRQRQAEAVFAGEDGFVPSVERPGLMILIDDCRLAFADAQVQATAIELTREGGKYGIALVGASQTVTQDTFGPANRAQDAEVLRTNLLAGNLLLFHLSSPSAGRLLGVDVDPSRLPKVPGYAHCVDRSGQGRSGALRTYFADERDGWANRIIWRPMDAAAAAAWSWYPAGDDEAQTEPSAALPDPAGWTYRPLPPELAARWAAAPKTWLSEEDPTTRLGVLLHTEVGHEGRCYTGRAVRAAVAAIPLGLAASVSYTAGQHVHHGGLGVAVAHWSNLNPTITLAALLAALVLCVGTAIGLHALWHHDEAPFAGNEILGLAVEPSDG